MDAENIILTERRNLNTTDIDLCDTLVMLKMINDEDLKVIYAIKECLPEIATAVDIIADNFLKGGRLLYFGAGTSGRLGILDASECPPTFNVSPKMVQGIIAGGDKAITSAIEGAEDSEELAIQDFDKLNITQNDTIVVISASGNAQYVVTILEKAKQTGARTIAITSNPNASTKEFSDCFICAKTGEEVISGSTRMKAGSAQKMILNMLTTASMIKIGKTYENLMIDVNPTNKKLKERAIRIVAEISGSTPQTAQNALENSHFKIKHSILKIKYNLDFDKSEELLTKFNGVLRKVFNYLESENNL